MTESRPSSASRRDPPRRLRAEGGGFTFIEIIIVIAVVGMLYMIGSVSFRGLMPKYYLKTTARTLGTTIEHVRLSAINRGEWMGIRYVLTPRGEEEPYYEIIPPPPEEDAGLPIEERAAVGKEHISRGIVFEKIVLPSGKEIEGGSVTVLLSPMGNSGSHIVVLSGDEGQRKMSVKLNAMSGMIEFVENAEVSFQHFED